MAEETIVGNAFVPKPSFNMTFHNDEKTVGTLDWSDGVLKFTGDIEESAKLLFEFLKPLMDHYLKGAGILVVTERNAGESDEGFVNRHLEAPQKRDQEPAIRPPWIKMNERWMERIEEVDAMNKERQERIKGEQHG